MDRMAGTRVPAITRWRPDASPVASAAPVGAVKTTAVLGSVNVHGPTAKPRAGLPSMLPCSHVRSSAACTPA